MSDDNPNNGARSFNNQIVGGDSWQLTLNMKWLGQAIFLLGTILWAAWSTQNRIIMMELELKEHQEEIGKLLTIHEAEENERIAHLEESLKWYEKEMVEVGGVSLNPLNWKYKKKKK